MLRSGDQIPGAPKGITVPYSVPTLDNARSLPYSSEDFKEAERQDAADQSKNTSFAGKIGIAVEQGIENGFASIIPDWIKQGSKSTGRDILVYGAAALIILAAVWGMLK